MPDRRSWAVAAGLLCVSVYWTVAEARAREAAVDGSGSARPLFR